MLEKIVRALVAKRAEMERAVFASPPTDWAAFNKRLGQYIELEGLISEMETLMRGMENDE